MYHITLVDKNVGTDRKSFDGLKACLETRGHTVSLYQTMAECSPQELAYADCLVVHARRDEYATVCDYVCDHKERLVVLTTAGNEIDSYSGKVSLDGTLLQDASGLYILPKPFRADALLELIDGHLTSNRGI